MSNTKKQPNVLFLFADQFRGDIMSYVGGPAKTPTLDAIAKEGVLFRQCVSPAPLCVPARIALFTGKYAHITGAWSNKHYVLSENANVWSKQLRDLGYDTSMFGKAHLHGGGADIIGREHFINSYGFDTVDEITGPHASCYSRTHITEMWAEKGLLEPFMKDIEKRQGPVAYPSPLPLEDYYDVYVGNKGYDYLKSYEGDKPWFCHVSFGGPHEPWDVPEPYSKMYDPSEMPAPRPTMKNANPNRPKGFTDKLMANDSIHCDPEQAGAIRADYCGNVTLIDEMIGRIVDLIKSRGEWENTIVIFSSDHGEMNGDQEFLNKKTFLDGALNIPLIIRTPETVEKGGIVSDALVNLIDIGPTIIDLLGGSIDYEQFGVSLRGVLDGTCEKPRDYVISELMGEIMYMDDEWKAATNKNGEIYLLFDRKNDKEEQYNLAGSEEAREISEKIKSKIFKFLATTQCANPSPLLDQNYMDYRSHR